MTREMTAVASVGRRLPRAVILGFLVCGVAGGPLAAQTADGRERALTRDTANAESSRSRCFGAVGTGCSPQFCAGGTCLINGGSWELDECCRSAAAGGDGGPGSPDAGAPPPACRAPWAKERARLEAGFSWTRAVDPSRPNRTGRVAFADYCALPGSRVHRDDVGYCCSREADPPPDGDHPDARICR